MATPKTWTATDLKMKKMILQMSEDNSILYAEQVYSFITSQGNEIEEIDPKRVSRSVSWTQVPQNIKDGLAAIQNYLYQQALIDEGME